MEPVFKVKLHIVLREAVVDEDIWEKRDYGGLHMKACTWSITIVNVTLFVLFWWMFWMGNHYLPGKLNGEMNSDVMLQKYQLVCSRLTASMATMCFLAIVIINIVLIYTYCLLKKKMSFEQTKDPAERG